MPLCSVTDIFWIKGAIYEIQLIRLQVKQILLSTELVRTTSRPSVCFVLLLLVYWLSRLNRPVNACEFPLPLCLPVAFLPLLIVLIYNR